MNARSLRRAAERKANKLARKDQFAQDDSAAVSTSQLSANRANAQLSTGPRTEEGRRISSLNAVKTGLTGQTVLLPSDDAKCYEQHVQRFVTDHKPQTERERELVQSMADAQWRMNRIPGLEMAIFARGRLQFAEQFAEHPIAVAAALTDAETLLVYGRQLCNLRTQENRIRRNYEKDLAELKALQQERADADPSPDEFAGQNGFEFSTSPSPNLNTGLPAAQTTHGQTADTTQPPLRKAA